MDIVWWKKIAWKSHRKPKNYREQALKYSDITATQGGKNNQPFYKHYLISSIDHICWKEKLGDLQQS